MLRRSDLDSFVRLAREGIREAKPSPPTKPDALLRSKTKSSELMHRNELWRLRKSLKIAVAAGDIPESTHNILHTIVQDLRHDGFIYLPLTSSKQWLDAVAWALHHPIHPEPDLGNDRQWVVGNACRKLRDRGYAVDIDSKGPRIDASVRNEIALRVDTQIKRFGGIPTAEEFFRLFRNSGKLHEGMWTLGNTPVSSDQLAQPSIPMGWLLAVALRNIRALPRPIQSTTDWTSAVQLATDFAATTDCQRYNQFDGLYLEGPDIPPAIDETLNWLELFMLPQVQVSVLPILRSAFTKIEWPIGTEETRDNIELLFVELEQLISSLSPHGLTQMPKRETVADYPLLWEHGRMPSKCARVGHLDPLEEHARDHEKYVFFEADDQSIVVLPPSLTAAAGIATIFRQVRKLAKNSASIVAGATIEKSVAIACQSHQNKVWKNVSYVANGQTFEMDVVAREGNEIVLFEAKAKSLTSKARIGDRIAFFADYTKSFLALLRQLVRHETHIKSGLTPITKEGEDLRSLKVTKIAVSPLSYGPVSDRLLINSLIHALASSNLESLNGDPHHTQVLQEFKKAVQQLIQGIDKIAPLSKDGRVRMDHYLHDVLWLDLGQLLYAIQRGRSLAAGLGALKHLSFCTRDFWTEAKLADSQGLTKGNWV